MSLLALFSDGVLRSSVPISVFGILVLNGLFFVVICLLELLRRVKARTTVFGEKYTRSECNSGGGGG